MSKILIETVNLNKTYKHLNGNITLFNNLNLKVKKGELVALVGPSGSGKSSLLHLLALLDDPTKGDIKINDVLTKNLLDEKKDETRRKNISIIFQDNNLLNDFTAIENVMMPLIIKGVDIVNAKKKAQKILRVVKIFDRSQHFPNELSGGEQQRVAIARAFACEAEVLFCDEPTGNLDSSNSELIANLIFDAFKESSSALIIVTHDLALADRCDQKIELINGKIL